MKYVTKTSITLLLAVYSFLGFSQTNPENIIIVYDSLNPNGRVVIKNELGSDLDSLSDYLLHDKTDELLTQKDAKTIKKLIIGSWTLESVKRTNGVEFNLKEAEKILFAKNGDFVLFNPDDTVQGKWRLNKEKNGKLELNYGQPQLLITDKTILKLMSAEQIKSITYSSNLVSIKEIDRQWLIFMTFIPENTENIEEMFYRLILTTYKKDE